MNTIRRLSPLIPYIAVLVGIYLMHSVWAAILGYHLGIAAVLWCDRSRRCTVGPRMAASMPLIAINILIGLCTGVLLYSLWPMLGIPDDLGLKLNRLGLTSWLGFGIYYCAVNPTIEELFWRRYLDASSPFPVWNDVFFAGYHMLVLALFMQWQWMAVSFALLVFASCIWRFSVKHPCGIALVTASHLLADLGIVLTGYLRTLHG